MEKQDLYKETVEAITKLDITNNLRNFASLPLAIPVSKRDYIEVLMEGLKSYAKSIDSLSYDKFLLSLEKRNQIAACKIEFLYKRFDKYTGAITLPNNSIPKRYEHFYIRSRVDDLSNGVLLARGASYYANNDTNLNSFQKLKVISCDIRDSISFICNQPVESNSEALPYYIGVIDYAKNGLLTLLHALTFR